MNALELKVPPAALVIIFAVAMWIVSNYVPSLAFGPPRRTVVAYGFVGAGVFITLAGIVAFRKVNTTVNPTIPGTTSVVVNSGIYRLSRNPMYVGFLFALTGWAAFLSHALAFAWLPFFVAYMNRFQISPEEQALTAKFGPEFADYKKSVRRWL